MRQVNRKMLLSERTIPDINNLLRVNYRYFINFIQEDYGDTILPRLATDSNGFWGGGMGNHEMFNEILTRMKEAEKRNE